MTFSPSPARRDEIRQSLSEAKENFDQAKDRAKEEMLRRIVEHCKRYQGPDASRSLGQFVLNFSIYAVLAGLMLFAVKSGYWPIALLLSPLAGGMLVKLFIIQHDCGHGSYFNNRYANHALGFFISLLTFTPYAYWRDAHNRHHASSGNLDRRGIGAVDTLTVEEYQRLTPMKQWMYRFYRHPSVLIFFGSPIYFLILQRLPMAGPTPYCDVYQGLKASQIWRSVVGLNIALVFFYGAFSLIFGLGAVALVVIPALSVAAWVGTWLFFVQHQYEDAYWAQKSDWDYTEAAIFGSSHYKLPTPLRWMTGNIGLHHIHHLASRIPNYRLMECYKASSDLLSLPAMTMRESLNCARLALYDATHGRMVSFAAARVSR